MGHVLDEAVLGGIGLHDTFICGGEFRNHLLIFLLRTAEVPHVGKQPQDDAQKKKDAKHHHYAPHLLHLAGLFLHLVLEAVVLIAGVHLRHVHLKDGGEVFLVGVEAEILHIHGHVQPAHSLRYSRENVDIVWHQAIIHGCVRSVSFVKTSVIQGVYTLEDGWGLPAKSLLVRRLKAFVPERLVAGIVTGHGSKYGRFPHTHHGVGRKDGVLPGFVHEEPGRVKVELECGSIIQIIRAKALAADGGVIGGKVRADRSPYMLPCRRIGPIHLIVRRKLFFCQPFTVFVILLKGLLLHLLDQFQRTDLPACVEEIVLHRLVGLVIVLEVTILPGVGLDFLLGGKDIGITHRAKCATIAKSFKIIQDQGLVVGGRRGRLQERLIGLIEAFLA